MSEPAVKGLRCKCGGSMRVTKKVDRVGYVYRRHECLACGKMRSSSQRFTDEPAPTPMAISSHAEREAAHQLHESFALWVKLSGLAADPSHNAANGDKQ